MALLVQLDAIRGWTRDDVKTWATTELCLDEVDALMLFTNKIDGGVLLDLTRADLERCGLPVGPVKKIMKVLGSFHPAPGFLFFLLLSHM